VPLWVGYTQRYSQFSFALICSVPLWVEYTQRYSLFCAVLIYSVSLWVEHTQMDNYFSLALICSLPLWVKYTQRYSPPLCTIFWLMNYITKTIIYCLFPTIVNNNNYFFCARSRQKPTSETISAFANIFLSLTFLKHIEVVLNLTAVRLYEYVVDKLS